MGRRGVVATLAAAVTTLAAAAPAAAETVYGLKNAAPPHELLRFDSADPAAASSIGPIAGLQPGERLLGIDARPATGQLYGVGDSERLYVIDAATAVASPVNSSPFSPELSVGGGYGIGIDFNPSTDVLRIVNQNGNTNIRVLPDTAVAFTDSPVNAGTIAGLAYSNNVAGAPGTTLFGYDFSVDRIYRIGGIDGVPSPNTGQATLIGDFGAVSFSGPTTGMDIAPSGAAYALINQPAGVARLFSVNLATGAGTEIGLTAPGLTDIAAAIPLPAPFKLETTTVSVAESGGSARLVISRPSSAGKGTVRLAATPGTAADGSDFVATTIDLAFAQGETTATATVPILDDAVGEGEETIQVAVTPLLPSGATADPAAGTITIVDDDRPAITIDAAPKRITVKKLLKKGIKVTATPSEPSSLRFELLAKAKSAAIGRAGPNLILKSVSLPLAADSQTAKLKPRKKLLENPKKGKLTIRVIATDAAGNDGVVTHALRLKP